MFAVSGPPHAENQRPQERGVTDIKGGEPFVVRDKMRGVCVCVQCGWEA